MSKTFQKIKPKAGEVFFLEVNLNHPFAMANVGELLHSFAGCNETKKECRDGQLREFFQLDSDAFQALLVDPRFREEQFALWHTTKKTILPVPYKFPKLKLEDVKMVKVDAFRIKSKRTRRS